MGHADQLLEDLDPEQREVATALDGPVRVLAGAGTGKTRAVTHRIAYGVATGVMVPSEVLAVTFTTRAAGELRERLHLLGAAGVQARTFHSAALRQARYFWPQVFGGELPEIVSSKLGLVAAAVRRHGLDVDQFALRDLAGEIEWAKVSNVTPDAYAELATTRGRLIDIGTPAVVAKLYDAYEDVKRDRHLMDFEDALLYAAAVIDADERVAMAVRKQYRWLVVDEFQDVSPLQFRLLQLWLGDGDRVCVVGDPAQTIYSFAGASDRFLREFPSSFAGTTSITLLRNYRSTPEVVELANTVMARQLGSAAVRLRSQRKDGPPVEVTAYSDEEAEASAVAAACSALVSGGTPAEDIAVLARINAQVDTVADTLRDQGISFTRPGQTGGVERSVAREALALLKGAVVAQSEVTGELVRDVRDVLSSMGLSTTPPDGPEARRRWDTLQGLVGAAERYARSRPDADVAGFVDDRRRSIEAGESHPGIGVTLTTLHAAKGLEWPVVFVVGAHEGNIPFVYRDKPSDVDEERRLFYVAVTRARDRVQVSWSRARTPGGRAGRRQTRFLDGIAAAAATEAAPTLPRTRSRGKAGALAQCRVCERPLTEARERKLGRCVDCPSPYDEALYDNLRAWRKETAADESLPAYCVFTDATMRALAEIKPVDLDALGRVPGIGPAKLGKYGDAILELCAATTG